MVLLIWRKTQEVMEGVIGVVMVGVIEEVMIIQRDGTVT